MAATALAASVTRIREATGFAADSYTVTAGDGTATFNLKGGLYSCDVMASTFGTVALQRLGPDGSTYLTVKDYNGTAISFSANGAVNVYLSSGKYKFTLA